MKSAALLRRALEKVPLVPMARTLYRVMDPATLYGFDKGASYTPRPLYNLGAPRGGARFTPKGGAPCVYLAGDAITAMRERTGIAGRAHLRPREEHGALLTYQVNVQLAAVLDVTEEAIQRALGTNAAELASPWRFRRDRKKPPTQRLGAAAARAGHIEAIRFKSTKGAGFCVVVFTDALRPLSFLEVRDARNKLLERIPPPPAPAKT